MGELNTTTLVSSTVRLNSTANILVSASNITAQVELILQAGADATLNAGTLINIESLTADVQGALDLGNNLLLNVTNGVDLLVNELILGDGAVIRSVTGDILANVTSTLEITTNSVFDAAGNINLNAVGDLLASANSTLRGAVVTLTSNASVLLQDVAEITATAELSVRAALNATVQVQQLVANGVSIVADEVAEIQSNIDSINVNDTLNSIDISGVQGVIVEADRVLRGSTISLTSELQDIVLNTAVRLNATTSIVLNSATDLTIADAVELISQAVELRSADNLVISDSTITATTQLLLSAANNVTILSQSNVLVGSLQVLLNDTLELAEGALVNVTNDVNLVINRLIASDGSSLVSALGDIRLQVADILTLGSSVSLRAAGDIILNVQNDLSLEGDNVLSAVNIRLSTNASVIISAAVQEILAGNLVQLAGDLELTNTLGDASDLSVTAASLTIDASNVLAENIMIMVNSSLNLDQVVSLEANNALDITTGNGLDLSLDNGITLRATTLNLNVDGTVDLLGSTIIEAFSLNVLAQGDILIDEISSVDVSNLLLNTTDSIMIVNDATVTVADRLTLLADPM